MYIKTLKYSAISSVLGTIAHFSAHTYVGAEAIVSAHLTATIAGFRSDLAHGWGYEPARIEPEPLSLPELIKITALDQNINPDLALALAQVESGLNPSAVSHAGAIGLLQIMPANAKPRCGLAHHTKLFDEKTNIECGVKILSQELATYAGDVTLALQAYNGGARAVRVIRGCGDDTNCMAGYRESYRHAQKVLAKLGALTPGRVQDKL